MKNKIIFLDSYSDASGGAPKSMLMLALLLKKEKFDVRIITANTGKLVELATENKVNCESVNVPSYLMKRRSALSSSFLSIIMYFFSIINLWVYLCKKNTRKKFTADFICINDIRCFLFYLPILVINKNKLIWYVRINDRVRIITKIAVILSKKIILVSSSCKKLFTSSELSKYQSKIEIIHTGFKSPKTHIKEYNKDEKKFLTISFIGVISKRKNIELLIDSVSLLPFEIRKKIIVNVIGDCKVDEKNYMSEIEKKINELKLNSNFLFLGHKENLENYYLNSDLVVLTSFQEGLPRVILEALSYGIYCISTMVDGINDIIISDEIGTITRSYEPSDLSTLISSSIENLEYINSYNNIKFRYKYISTNFSTDAFSRKFMNCLSSI
ncbi:glycosyltransferase [Providencia vermicola]|uniref:glycosyltransferase n=1 Tax=Providencia vermicola TaxID=333965 RepID=UPI0032DA7063